ncbi:MAG: Crp/Fnr family transcriptional regulator [Rickettsiales bacterium]
MNKSNISYDIIWTIPFFSDLNEQEKKGLIKLVHFKNYNRGEIIFLQGDKLKNVYWVCDGSVQMFRETPDGHELTASICIFSETLYYPNAVEKINKNHMMNARAVSDVTLLEIPAIWIEESIRSCNHLANKFINIMANNTLEAMIDSEHQATMSATQILACFLQKICVNNNFNNLNFELPYTKSLIASRLGMELETLSRSLPKLIEHGITVNGKNVSFDDCNAIQQHSCDSCSISEECRYSKKIKEFCKERS